MLRYSFVFYLSSYFENLIYIVAKKFKIDIHDNIRYYETLRNIRSQDKTQDIQVNSLISKLKSIENILKLLKHSQLLKTTWSILNFIFEISVWLIKSSLNFILFRIIL